ncbi:uncharacterized protein LOC110711841 isoform X2 [Chenopodium quinoa]|uniref:uncharacterized protein LOC110711841 isoform X2 n=1 Tax=Chenopodium quinoa TaxID=63459 RepID=UPI000B784B34|nr:uncharacterized protein LOC110711841 isoform X2 [Chenopodium quinoa]
MLKRLGEEPSQPPSKSKRVPVAPPSSGRPPMPDRTTSGGKSLKDLGLNTRPAEVEMREPETPSSRQFAVATGSNAADGMTPQPENEDASSRWPDLQHYAKRMLRTLTRSEKEVVAGVHQVNIDRINSLLAEVMLRVDGLKVPLRKKQEEEELVKELTAAADMANKKADDFKLQVKNLQADVKALGDADKEDTQLRADVSRLKNELAQT